MSVPSVVLLDVGGVLLLSDVKAIAQDPVGWGGRRA